IPMKPNELKEWRQRIGYSQNQLARVLDVNVMTVSRWERGVREIPSFLHLALSYLELKGVEINKIRERDTRKKGGK
ncbi:MAG: helix-turn-helix domain-containing protein, partial [Deltaproteobacteria bacterium]|nr:helix-turn-helix domain-containing protein [Deltaproteobacteria bacterium]